MEAVRRRQLLNDLGGLPDDDGPLNAKVYLRHETIDCNRTFDRILRSLIFVAAPQCTDSKTGRLPHRTTQSAQFPGEDFPTITSNVPGTTFQ